MPWSMYPALTQEDDHTASTASPPPDIAGGRNITATRDHRQVKHHCHETSGHGDIGPGVVRSGGALVETGRPRAP